MKGHVHFPKQDRAWKRIQTEAEYNKPAPNGMQHLAVCARGMVCPVDAPFAVKWSVLGALSLVYGPSTAQPFWDSRRRLWDEIARLHLADGGESQRNPPFGKGLEISEWEAATPYAIVFGTLKGIDL